ncbi:hypothetical protein G7046_g4971 [Stylonectria norvegica]|nr:hypothetical protein G7046_g4971 [Stylonectria norvegica]
MSAGTESPAAPFPLVGGAFDGAFGPPSVPPPPPPQRSAISRYRSLRGKSVSSTRSRPFDVFQETEKENFPARDGPKLGSSATMPSIAMRRRSKSVAAAPTGRGLLVHSPTGGLSPRLAPRAAMGAVHSPPGTPASRFAGSPPGFLARAPEPGGHVPGAPGHGPDDPPPLPLMPMPPLPLGLQIPTAVLSRKPVNVPIRKPVNSASYSDLKAPANFNLTHQKSLNDLAFSRNSGLVYRAAKLERDEAERRRQDEREAARWADEVARLEAETDRILAEQKKRDAARVQAQQATSRPKYLIFEKFTFLSRGRRSNAGSQVGTPSPTTNTVFSLDFSRSSSPELSPSPVKAVKMNFIEKGGRGIDPQMDAPTSASNGGERRVTVRCQSSTINLPVTPDTSPTDILYSAANLTSHDIDPATSILVECYIELGLERRLRRYERVRDVMNSWDRDQQNSLLILTYDNAETDSDVTLASVPRTENPPAGFNLQLYHSSRPGKWNKRWVTLLESGQMFASKKPDARASDKDSTALCHLSDFDIYTPRESEARRHLKAPKQFCYAVKSQQKTVAFPKGENFVHFFCCDDAKLAQRFKELVQTWRSWYLVNKKVDLQRKDKAPQVSKRAGTVKRVAPKSTSVVKEGSHRVKVSVDESPYTIGAFRPLLDLDRFDKPIDDFGKEFVPAKGPEMKSEQQEPQPRPKEKRRPKMLTKSHSHHQPPSGPPTPQGDGEFSPTGLLGNAYEQMRRQAERQPQEGPKADDGPFTNGPSLLNAVADSPLPPQDNRPADARPWFPSATEHTARPTTSPNPLARPGATI